MQTGGQRAGISVNDFGYDGERLLLKVMLLYEQALCGRQSADGLNEQPYALVIVRIQHAVGLVVRNGLERLFVRFKPYARMPVYMVKTKPIGDTAKPCIERTALRVILCQLCVRFHEAVLCQFLGIFAACHHCGNKGEEPCPIAVNQQSIVCLPTIA